MRQATLQVSKRSLAIDLAIAFIGILTAGSCIEGSVGLYENGANERNISMTIVGCIAWLSVLVWSQKRQRHYSLWQREKKIETIACEVNKALIGFGVINTCFTGSNLIGIIYPGGLLPIFHVAELQSDIDGSTVPWLEQRELHPPSRLEKLGWFADRGVEIFLFTFSNYANQLPGWGQAVLVIPLVFWLLRKPILRWIGNCYTSEQLYGDFASNLQSSRDFANSLVSCREIIEFLFNEHITLADKLGKSSNIPLRALFRRAFLFSLTLMSVLVANDIIKYERINNFNFMFLIMSLTYGSLFFSHELGRGRPRKSNQQLQPFSENSHILFSYLQVDQDQDQEIQHEIIIQSEGKVSGL